MKNLVKKLAIISFVLIGLIGCSSNQTSNDSLQMIGGGSGGKGMKGNGKKAPYNYDTYETVTAVINKIGESETNIEGGVGLHLYVTTRTDKEYVLHVAPQFYIDEQNIKFKVGEKLVATGSHFVGAKTGGDNLYVSLIIKADGTTLSFRDKYSGEGVWKTYMQEKMQHKMRNEMREKMQRKHRNQ